MYRISSTLPEGQLPASDRDREAPSPIDLGLRAGKLYLDRLLVHLNLLQAQLVLRRQLVGCVLGLVVGNSRDDTEVEQGLVSLRLQLVLRVIRSSLPPQLFLSINVLCSVA